MRIPQLPPLFTHLQIPLLFATNILTLAIGPRHRLVQFAFSVPVLFLLAAQSAYREWTGGWGIHYAINACVMMSLAAWVDWIVLSSPDREAWVRVDRSLGTHQGVEGMEREKGEVENNALAETQREKAAAPIGFKDRLCWAMRLATTNRYTGWSCEVKNVPVEVGPGYSRFHFIARKTLRAALFYLAKDALYSYTASSPHGTWLDIAHHDPPVSFSAWPLWYRVWYTWVYIALTYVSLEWANTLYGIASVATGLSAPIDCPSMFGDLRGVWSVRRAWSVVWHQQMRRSCSAPGIYLVRDVLQLRRGSFMSKYLQLFVGFGVSGAIHAGASMLCHASLDDDGAMRAFLYQAVIILVEDHAVEFGKKCGFKDSKFWCFAGLGWTVLTLGVSLESWTGRTLSHGLWVHDREADFFGIGPK